MSGTITKKLTHYSYNFTGAAGQKIMFDALPSDANMRVRIYDPNGRMLNQDDSPNHRGGGQSLNYLQDSSMLKLWTNFILKHLKFVSGGRTRPAGACARNRPAWRSAGGD